MKRFFAIVAFLQVLVPGMLKADEGMWLPALIEKLNITQMKDLGLEISAEQIYSINQSSLKDAIVEIGRAHV